MGLTVFYDDIPLKLKEKNSEVNDASRDESAENGEVADHDEPAAAGRRSGRVRQGPLIEETVSGKIIGTALTAAWEELSLKSFDESMTFR